MQTIWKASSIMSMAGMLVFFLMPDPVSYAESYRYIEGIVRGYRNSLLTGQNYSNLAQCETIDGLHAIMEFHVLSCADST